ncbi:MAG: hypothetical protein ACRDHM_08075 [Actinomycetota bacterium]
MICPDPRRTAAAMGSIGKEKATIKPTNRFSGRDRESVNCLATRYAGIPPSAIAPGPNTPRPDPRREIAAAMAIVASVSGTVTNTREGMVIAAAKKIPPRRPARNLER